jgi:hypothetical protein
VIAEAPLLCGRGEPRLARLLFRLEPGDLALDRLDEALALGEPGLDLLLGGGPLGDHLLLPGLGLLQERRANRDVVLELLDLADHLRVLRGDAVDRLDAVQELGQAVRPEQNRERRVVLRLLVHRPDPVAEAALRNHEVVLRDREVPRVQRTLGLDPRQIFRRAVVRLHGPLQLRVEGLDLVEHALGLGPLGRDLRRLTGGRTRNHDGRHEP